MNKQVITNLIYNASEEEVKHYLQSCTDAEDLYLYVFDYNREAGFDIPNIILNNQTCTISTAKLIFWRADGTNYLRSKDYDDDVKLAGTNFIQAKRTLEEGNAVYSALAADIQKHIAEIHNAEVQFNIIPDYPYDINEVHSGEAHDH